MQSIRRGDTGPAVAEVRAVLTALGVLTDSHTTDEYDRECEVGVRAFQQRRGLTVDGIVGPETYRAITAARWRLGDRVLQFTVAHPMVGDDVATLQVRLLEMGYDAGRNDGVFGAKTETALRAFQRDYGLSSDGTFGPATMRALRQLGRRVVGGRPQLLRESAAVAVSGPNLLGKRVVIDPGHGGADLGIEVGDSNEATVVWDLATRLEGRLAAFGVTVYLTRGPGGGPTDLERAQFANATGADLLISLHVDGSSSPLANGVAAYHYGTGIDTGVASTIGERLAGLVHREVVARTGLRDCHTHGKSWELLRRTRMAAIRLEVGYLTNPTDRAKLTSPAFRDDVAEAILVGVQRLYLPADADPPTGTYVMPQAGSRSSRAPAGA